MITVICPVYNESAYIMSVLDFFSKSLPLYKELILIDGNSSDNTCDLIEAYRVSHSNISLLRNPDRYVAYALNKAILAAKGDIIVRLDAHTDYSADYFQKIQETFDKTGADIVGGPMRIAGGNTVQNAIGHATSTVFGVGNSSFHFENFKGFTDSVYLGAWKRKIFDKTGLFDTTFKRNQDDEFHYRAKSMGFTVYQDPSIKLYYHPRKTFGLLFSQYYQYGLYKPMVLKKVKSAINVRHIIPSLFVVYLATLPFFLVFAMYFMLLPLGIYLATALCFTLTSKHSFKEIFIMPMVYFTLHVAYGAGFIAGLSLKPGSSTPSGNRLIVSN